MEKWVFDDGQPALIRISQNFEEKGQKKAATAVRKWFCSSSGHRARTHSTRSETVFA